MRRAKKTKEEAAEPSPEVEEIMVDAKIDEQLVEIEPDAPQAAAPAAAAPPDALQQELEAAREEAFVAAEAAAHLAEEQRMASVAFHDIQKKYYVRCCT